MSRSHPSINNKNRRRTMKTKNIFKTLALAMLMPTMLLTTACSSEDDVVNNTANTENTINKGYALPVTVNVTREGDAATRATYNESTKKLEFSTGDKLFVYGSTTAAGSFAGELDYVPATSKFSGTIYTQEEWTGTADALFAAASAVDNLTATLLPNGYDASSNSFLSINNNSTTDIAYDDRLTVSGSYAFVASETAKATGVEQLSWEQASTYSSTYSSGFALSPGNAILNFTITGLEAGAKDVSLQIHHGFDYTVTGSVTPNAGVATFAIGVPVGANIKDMSNNLTVGSSNFTLPSSTTFAAGKIYNITRSTGATVDLSTKNTDYTAQNGETLTGTLDANVKISIADGATVILNNVTINGTNGEDYGWAGISCEGNATIILSGTNIVKGFNEDYPGIYVYGDPDNPSNNKTLTINGTGSLTASSNGFGAGIGGGRGLDCGNIEIQGGTVTATGSLMGAGIGSGYQGTCNNITISGGTVTATGGEGAAGIGSSNQGTCNDITISGGTVEATGGYRAAGIGSGNGASCGIITISSGTVTATGGSQAAGIGSGANVSRCGDITITSGVTHVTATKAEEAPNSIGAGEGSTCGTVSIEDSSKVTEN